MLFPLSWRSRPISAPLWAEPDPKDRISDTRKVARLVKEINAKIRRRLNILGCFFIKFSRARLK